MFIIKMRGGNYKFQNARGFTLVEAMLVLAIFVILAGVSAPFFSQLMNRNDLTTVNQASISTLRRAQLLSQAIENDCSWGVKFLNGSIALFCGESYDTRQIQYDEVLNFSPQIVFEDLTEVTFERFSGLPLISGILTVKSNANNETKNIIISSSGLIAN